MKTIISCSTGTDTWEDTEQLPFYLISTYWILNKSISE